MVEQRGLFRNERMQQDIPYTTLGLWFPTIPYRIFFLGPKNWYMDEQSKLFVSDNQHCVEHTVQQHRCPQSLMDDDIDDWCIRTTRAAFTQLYMSMINPRRPRVVVNTAMEAWEMQGILRMPIYPDSVMPNDVASPAFRERMLANFRRAANDGGPIAGGPTDEVATFVPSPDPDRLIGFGCLNPLPTRCMRESYFGEGSLEEAHQPQPAGWNYTSRCWMALPYADEVHFDVELEEMEGILKVFTKSGRVYPRVRTLIFRDLLMLEPHVLVIARFFPAVLCVRCVLNNSAESYAKAINSAGAEAFGLLWHVS